MTGARSRASVLAVLGLAVLAGCPASEDAPPPAVTAQGFDLAQPRTGTAGAFSDLRVRFEVASGIEHLVIRERSYEVDLAKSPDAAHLPLFGLERRVWSKHDVTLDFAPYVNDKIRAPGTYAFDIRVTDRAGRAARAELRVLVPSPESEAPDEPPDEPGGQNADEAAAPASPARASAGAPLRSEQPFRLERVGAGSVEGPEPLGITWYTVDAVSVVIRMSAGAGADGAARLARLEPGTYEALATTADLSRALDRAELAESLDIATANDAAARTVVAVVRPDSRYVLRTDHSHTSLSERGTTVTLTGRYRY